MSNVSALTATAADRMLTPESLTREHTNKLRESIQVRTDLRIEIDRLNEKLHVVERNIQVHEAVLNSLR